MDRSLPSTEPTPVQTCQLHFKHLDRHITARVGDTVFQSARRHGVRIVGACGGRGTCGTCVIRLDDGNKKWRKACQVEVSADCSVEVAPRSLAPVVRAEVDQDKVEILAVDPCVVAHDLRLPEATLADTASDLDRVLQALPAQPRPSIDLHASRHLPNALRDSAHAGHWHPRVYLRQHAGQVEILDLRASLHAKLHAPLGLAIDLGTTNAAGFLIDLSSGQRLASLGVENPQAAWGADLISRINHATRGASVLTELQQAAVEVINALAHDLCHAVHRPLHDVMDVVVCGNTAMHHLLLGLPVRQLGRAPFVAALREGQDLKARDLGLQLNPGAWLHVVANVGGFVGGDHVTALLATEPHWLAHATPDAPADAASLVMDIGTNTEISLIHQGRVLSASCPSGPALEGGHISCGMRAAEGAIERVWMQDGRLAVQTIDHKPAVGLCGSGVLDVLATLISAGLVDRRGRIATGHADVVTLEGKRAALLAPGVYFTQDDVRAVQLAKAAIRTGVDMLLRQAGLPASAIQHFVIAGAFGAYIDVASGIATGLFPPLPRERFVQVGNAAGLGVRQMLASSERRARAHTLAATCRYVELSTRADFQACFLEHIGFPKPPLLPSGPIPQDPIQETTP